jgi:hypothetical protein
MLISVDLASDKWKKFQLPGVSARICSRAKGVSEARYLKKIHENRKEISAHSNFTLTILTVSRRTHSGSLEE